VADVTEYFIIMTLQGIQSGDFRTVYRGVTYAFGPETTRIAMFTWMLDQFPADCRDHLGVVFFSAEPNSFGGRS
jgi:hypothetical protein